MPSSPQGCRLPTGPLTDALLDVSLENSVHVLVLLHCHVESTKQPLGGEIVHYQTVRQLDRLRRNRGHLRIETKIENQFFGGSSNAAEIGISGTEARRVDRKLSRRLSLRWRRRRS